MVYPVFQVLRIGEMTTPAPGKIVHSMLKAEEVLDKQVRNHASTDWRHDLASDLLRRINAQHDGHRYHNHLGTQMAVL